ncbi:toluene tolerance protein [Pseudomonas sp. 5P_3.1_Bac2]|uniref:toluene tolerance protein n=1 Tax=Pseudomonas sp. 5P_3.1_Bac2 TaxID=2971617 RepID=UPI0021C6AB2F|nr:toluene tolerance protein [Pseudomonas sp. 5P_3.1_Bac2]MCU1718332.1 toluene tolerance protein [Pseudomonas sp. 5P_3.1_Bac2]
MQCSKLTQAALNQMIEGAKLLEADSHGPKVYLLRDGNILKLFRRKRFLSSALLKPYSKRFIENAKRLASLGVPTLKVMDFYQLDTPTLTAVRYQPLPGKTLRQIADQEDFDWANWLPKLAGLIRGLHSSGIYFRSLHLGNIVLTPEQQLGLIDVADMRFLRRALPRKLVKRNLQHFAGYIAREKLDDFPMHALEQALLTRT